MRPYVGNFYVQFSSLEEFQQEFQNINQEEQVGRLHKMLAPHLLRRKLELTFVKNTFVVL